MRWMTWRAMNSRPYSLEMVRQLLERDTVMAGRPAAGGHVVATCRNPDVRPCRYCPPRQRHPTHLEPLFIVLNCIL